MEGRIEMELKKKKTTTNNQATFRDKEGHNLKKKLLDTTKRPNSRPGQGEATLRGQTIFFQYRFSFL